MQSTNQSVSRRFKHFDWLYCRLLEKFTCLSIPPIPDKQITGLFRKIVFDFIILISYTGNKARAKFVQTLRYIFRYFIPRCSGKYAEDFVEKRREGLERWLNRLCRHPVVHKSAVFQHFLYCNDDEKVKQTFGGKFWYALLLLYWYL